MAAVPRAIIVLGLRRGLKHGIFQSAVCLLLKRAVCRKGPSLFHSVFEIARLNFAFLLEFFMGLTLPCC